MNNTHTNMNDTNTCNTSGLPIAQLGSTIRAHIDNITKYEDKATQLRMTAGLCLIEAKARIAAGEFAGDFRGFLLNCCKGLGESRAYELIAIAGGKVTQEDHREKARARDQAYRDRKAEAGRVRRPTEPVESMASPKPVSATLRAKEQRRAEAARAQAAADDLIARAKTGDTAMPLIEQIVAACRGLSMGRLQEVLSAAQGAPSVTDAAGVLGRQTIQRSREANPEMTEGLSHEDLLWPVLRHELDGAETEQVEWVIGFFHLLRRKRDGLS